MLHMIVNPTAGNGRTLRVETRLVEMLSGRGIAHKVFRTESIGHATELAREAALAGVETVLAVGGDGTVCEVVRGLKDTKTALGIIPAGTGNDVARMLAMPKKPEEALDFVLTKPPRPLDVGRINDELFLNVCGTGFDVCVLDYTITAKKYVRGMLPYLWGVIRTIFTYKPVVATFEVDGEAPFTKPLLLLAVANGRYIGGGMDVAPASQPDDGLFDLITVESMPNWKMPAQLPRLVGGRIMQIPGVAVRRCRRVTVTAKNMRINLDGGIEPMEKAVFEVVPGALLVHW